MQLQWLPNLINKKNLKEDTVYFQPEDNREKKQPKRKNTKK